MESTVNERLKVLMKALDIKPAHLARTLGISPSTLHNYTDRQSKPGYEVLEKLFSSFEQINIPWFFGRPGKPLLSNEERGNIAQQGERNLNIGTNHGDATYLSLADCEKLNAGLRVENDLLRSNLTDKERIIRLYEGQQSKP